MGKVDHGEDWDIKRQIPWEKTIGTTFPGSYDTVIIYKGNFTTPEILGNFWYGYTGTAAGFSENVLIAGSIFASGIYKKGTTEMEVITEFADHKTIRKGIAAYNEQKN